MRRHLFIANNGVCKFAGLFLTVVLLCISTSGFSQDNLKALLAEVKLKQPDTAKVLLYNKIATYYLQNQPALVKPFSQNALKLARQLKYQKGIGLIMITRAKADLLQSNHDESRKGFGQALALFAKINYKPGMAAAYIGLANLEYKINKYPQANIYALRGLKIYESIGNQAGIMEAYNRLGLVDMEVGDFKKALELLEKANTIGSKLPMSDVYLNTFSNMGVVYRRTGNNQKAIHYHLMGLKKIPKGNFAVVRTRTLINAGLVLRALKREKEAGEYFKEALDYSIKNGLKELQATALLNISLLEPDTAKAIDYNLKALQIAKEIHQNVLMSNIYLNLEVFYRENGDYKNAMTVMETIINLQDSLFTLDKAKQIADLQSSHELNNSKEKVQRLEIEKYKGNNQRNIVMLVAGAFLVISVVIAFYYRKQQELNRLLNIQKQDLDGLNTIKDKIFSIVGHDLRGPMSSISASFYLLENDMFDDENSKKDLFKRLRILHRSSYDTLTKLLYWGTSQLKVASISQELFDPGDLINTNFELISDPARVKNIEVICDIPDDLKIYADPNHFEFIFRNILHNAIKFTNKDGIISVTVVEEADKDLVTFSIRDNGVGMPKEVAAEIFNKKYVSTKGTDNETGTGLGLMLCKEFIEENGGNIRVESKPGQGTAFFVTFRASKK
jgi:signal transduction histidine kinase